MRIPHRCLSIYKEKETKMKLSVNHPTYGTIVYDENIWTGKKTLKVNDVTCFAVSKKEFLVGDQKVFLSGNLYTGIRLSIGQETVEISPRPTWYEIVLAILPVAFLLTWGNSPALCAIFPVIGGAIGGGIGALFSMTSLLMMKKANSPLYKVLIGLGMFAANLLVAFILALALISLIA